MFRYLLPAFALGMWIHLPDVHNEMSLIENIYKIFAFQLWASLQSVMRVRFCLANRKWIAVSSDILIVDPGEITELIVNREYIKKIYMFIYAFIYVNLFLYSSYWSYWNVKENNWIIYLYFPVVFFFRSTNLDKYSSSAMCYRQSIFERNA